MKRLSLLLATLTVVACNGDRLTGAAAQDAARKYHGAVAAQANAPLFIVDGKEMSTEQWRTKDFTDIIESVQVFKGNAARELYGDRGRNGVIVIETKAGR